MLIFIGAVQKNIIQVNHQKSIRCPTKCGVFCPLKFRRGIYQSKKEYNELKQPIYSKKSSSLFIPRVSQHLIVGLSKIDLIKDPYLTQHIQDIIYIQQRVRSQPGLLIQYPVIHIHPVIAIFFMDKNDQSPIW